MSVIFQKGRDLRDIQLLYLFVSQTFGGHSWSLPRWQEFKGGEKNNPQPSEKQVKSLWEQRVELHQSLNVCHPGSPMSTFPISDTSLSVSVQKVTRAVFLESSEEQTIIAFQISWQTFSKIICSFICASPSDILTSLLDSLSCGSQMRTTVRTVLRPRAAWGRQCTVQSLLCSGLHRSPVQLD